MTRKILIIDDDRSVRQLVAASLQPIDCETLEAGDGDEGYALAVTESPDLILLDIMMPRCDGVELLRKIRGDFSLAATPIIVLTSIRDRDKINEIISLGVRDFLPKPFFVEMIREKVENVFAAPDEDPLSDFRLAEI